MTRLLTKASTSARIVVALTLAGLLAGSALGIRGRAARSFGLSSTPSSRAIIVGATARYRIAIRRHHWTGPVALHLRGIPPAARARITLTGRARASATLTVATSDSTPAGRYGLRLRGSSGSFAATLSLRLTIAHPRPVAFGIAADPSGLLWPGTLRPLNLALRNPNRFSISVRSITVSVTSIHAPLATLTHPCTLADFSVRQLSASFPIILPGSSSVTLAALGMAPARWPQVELIDRPLNQDGCQGATVSLAYAGGAEAP